MNLYLPPVNSICPICSKRIGKRDLRMRVSLEWEAPYGHSSCVRFGRAFSPVRPSREEMRHESAMLERTGYGDRIEA